MTKGDTVYMDILACNDSENESMSFDIFKDAAWRHKLSEKADGDETTVTLPSGKTITVNTKFLRFLRVLGEELASKEPIKH
ncbi:MAG: hypothetical protein HKN14_07715 [Marinicaulis sp.]|nr:hypothetical protein [Marinicaulis sp.]NNL87608.1 hypothetical protein [Marinicaulis sp.]